MQRKKSNGAGKIEIKINTPTPLDRKNMFMSYFMHTYRNINSTYFMFYITATPRIYIRCDCGEYRCRYVLLEFVWIRRGIPTVATAQQAN